MIGGIERVNRTSWLKLIAGVLVLLLIGRMGLRYLDWQASEAQRADATRPAG